jgi:hypothetical protein
MFLRPGTRGCVRFQSDIVQRAAQTLEVGVIARERYRIEREPMRNLKAYKLYLKGRHF